MIVTRYTDNCRAMGAQKARSQVSHFTADRDARGDKAEYVTHNTLIIAVIDSGQQQRLVGR